MSDEEDNYVNLDSLVMCSAVLGGCVYEDNKVCVRGIKCEHQITQQEIYESNVAHQEAGFYAIHGT